MTDGTGSGGAAPRGIARGLTSYGDAGFSLFIRGAYARGAGLTAEDLARPVIGIAQTWSEFNPCHRHLREVADAVKRGVLQAGALPLEFPTISLGEIYLSPTSMLFRNLMAMDTEEMIRGQPMDGVVLLGGCDKTLPAQLMAAASADRPAIVVTAGPMLTGRYEGARLGDQHANFGLVAGGGGSQRLPRLIGARRAKELMLLGGWLSAAEALAWGLVNRVAPAGTLGAVVDEIAASLAAKSASAGRTVKALVNRAFDVDLTSGLEMELHLTAIHMRSPDAAEGLRAFAEKRKPVFHIT